MRQSEQLKSTHGVLNHVFSDKTQTSGVEGRDLQHDCHDSMHDSWIIGKTRAIQTLVHIGFTCGG